MVIQRCWKIPSDVGGSLNNTTTTANDVQQRSSPAMQMQSVNSSDDSDCSNQTTHSMDTRVASPAEGTKKQPDKEKTPEATATTSLTLSLLAELPSTNTEPLKYVTTSDMAETMLQRIRQRLGGSQNIEGGGSAESAMRALELLRISVQQSFDSEVNEIIKRYMNNYFKPAFGNIKENLGQQSVNEETLQKMSSCALLENAKAQYTNFVRQHRLGAGVSEQQRLALKRVAKQQENAIGNKVFANNLGFAATKPMPCTAATVNQMPALQAMQMFPQQAQLQTVQPLQQQQQQQQQQHRMVTPILGGALPTPVRRQIFWNTAQISTSTKFVLDVQANLAFGFGTDGKERLASKHPELIRYLPDAEDREWLAARGIIPAESTHLRFLFLLHDEVCRLHQAHDLYKNKPNVDLTLMMTFNVPDPMIHKMRLFFVDLNIKSRGLITNSFIMTNQPHPQPQQQTVANNSHLRNALLQGALPQPQQQTQQQSQQQSQQPQLQQHQLTTGTIEDSVLKELPAASPTPCLQGQIVGSTTTPLKAKLVAGSTLSSSHATLTALLNNGGAGVAVGVGVGVGVAPVVNPAPSTTGKFRN
ncbi:uncharacterized protein LOC6604287 [Drosophila persimilis]|uniref:uncharacterized protein LOC6604287 n=1 Tax=Drosophila persimilis TaxID=7234 RepID=UPI000F07A4CE|nr:uncharacterized protein LOC6604287 [Drosophila persimilis]